MKLPRGQLTRRRFLRSTAAAGGARDGGQAAVAGDQGRRDQVGVRLEGDLKGVGALGLAGVAWATASGGDVDADLPRHGLVWVDVRQ